MSFQPPFTESSSPTRDQSMDLVSKVRIDKITMEETIPLRHSVLWPNMPPSHVCLPEDAIGTHYGAFLPLRKTPVAVISLFFEDLPSSRDEQDAEINLKFTDSNSTIILRDEDGRPPAPEQQRVVMRFRKFACDREFQGKGIGTQLLVHVLSMARTELNAGTVWCDARATARGWYMKRGLVSFGPAFYKGPEEYIRMRIDF